MVNIITQLLKLYTYRYLYKSTLKKEKAINVPPSHYQQDFFLKVMANNKISQLFCKYFKDAGIIAHNTIITPNEQICIL